MRKQTALIVIISTILGWGAVVLSGVRFYNPLETPAESALSSYALAKEALYYGVLKPNGILQEPDAEALDKLSRRIIELELPRMRLKARSYYDKALYLIPTHYQEHGNWIVSRNGEEVKDTCDSTLFTGLSIYGLQALATTSKSIGDRAEYLTRKQAAVKSFQNNFLGEDGFPVRHPKCQSPGLSRDMAIGVSMILNSLDQDRSAQPFNDDFDASIASIRGAMAKSLIAGGGVFISPFWRDKLPSSAINPSILPMLFPSGQAPGFLANDMIIMSPEPRGYVSHLNALTVLFELNAIKTQHLPTIVNNALVRNILPPAEVELLAYERLRRITDALVEIDQENTMFKAIKALATVQAAEAYAGMRGQDPEELLILTGFVKRTVLADLIIDFRRLEQKGLFPDEDLPNGGSGNRFQEYLWQRASDTWTKPQHLSKEKWPGIDYLMMTAILSLLDDRA